MGSVRYLLSFLVVTAIWLGSAAAAEAQKVSLVLGNASAGFEASVLAQIYPNATCSGSPLQTENIPLALSPHSVALDATRSVRLTAPSSPDNGGAFNLTRFNHWSSGTPFAPVTSPRDVCVQGPPGNDVWTMTAFYELPQVPVPPVVCSNATFAEFPTSPFPSSDTWKGLTIADVDGDGNNDIVSGSQSNNRLEIRYGNGHGGFTPPLMLNAPNLYNNGSSFDIRTPHVLDLNGDGRKDVIAAMQNIDQLGVWLQQPGGGFIASSSFMPLGGAVGPQTLSLGDLNNDGKVDAVSGNFVNRTAIVVRLGNGNGTFGGSTGIFLTFADSPYETAVGDFNGDGHNDVVANLTDFTGVAVYRGNSTGGLLGGIRSGIPGANGSQGLAVADFNSDGKPDVAVGGSGIFVRFGNGASQFLGGPDLAAPGGSREIVTADFNHDGKTDIAATSGQGAVVYLGDGAGGFTQAFHNSVGDVFANAIGAGDLDRDGRDDFAFGAFHNTAWTSSMYLFKNTCESNLPPTVTPSTLSRQIGGSSNGSPSVVIAQAIDDRTPARELGVTLGLVPSSLKVSAPFNDNGNIFAKVDALCSATPGPTSFVIEVTDGHGVIGKGTIAVQLSPDVSPFLGIYAKTVMTAGQSFVVKAGAAPFDNGAVTSMLASAPGFTGSFSVDLDSGDVTVIDAGPPGTHMVTITAIDNCGKKTQGMFELTVRGIGSIDLSDLRAVYDGQPHGATVRTTPPHLAGLKVRYLQGGVQVGTPVNPGLYDVEATVADPLYDVPATFGVLVIDKAPATMQFGVMSFTYDGTQKLAKVITTPPALDGVAVSYVDASGAVVGAPINAGVYQVTAKLTNSFYQADGITGTLTIEKAAATIAMPSASFVYDGSAKALVATVDPHVTGLTVKYTAADGTPVEQPTNPGVYGAMAALSNANYKADAVSATLGIKKAAATMQFDVMSFTYDGTPKLARVVTAPAGLEGVTLSYTDVTGATVAAPVNAGEYVVRATLTNDFHAADPLVGTLTIARARVTITIANTSFPYDGSPKALTVSVTPDVPGLSVQYRLGDGTVVASPINAGTYHAIASMNHQNYMAIDETARLTITQVKPLLTWNTPAPIVAGAALGGAELNAHASVPGAFSYTPAAGTVLPEGSHSLNAVFTPADAVNYEGGTIAVLLIVKPQPAPSLTLRQTKEHLLTQLRSLRTTVRDRHTRNGLDDVIDNVEKSLHPWLWAQDGNHLNKWLGSLVFGFEKHAAMRLRELIKNKQTSVPDATLQTFITGFAQVDRGLAARAIDDAGTRWIGDAREDLEEGDADLAAGRIASAFEHYRDAWSDATRDRRFWNDGDDHGHDYDDCDHGHRGRGRR